MNPIRERVLEDNGSFTDKNHVRKMGNTEEIEFLKGELVKVKKALRGRDEHWESLRSTEYVKAVDQGNAKGREANELKRDMDRLQVAHKKECADKDAEIARLTGVVEQLKKEVSSAMATPTVKKKSTKKK